MSDYAVEYGEPRRVGFWCEQDGNWHPACECTEQCFQCGLIQTDMEENNPKEKIIEIITRHTPETNYVAGANAADEIIALFNLPFPL